jgi:hypothetical protein
MFVVAFGMAYLWFENSVHRDRKPAKTLLDKNCLPQNYLFGFSKLISLENAMKMTTELGNPALLVSELDDKV